MKTVQVHLITGTILVIALAFVEVRLVSDIIQFQLLQTIFKP